MKMNLQVNSTRFGTEAKGNSEIAYWRYLHLNFAPKTNQWEHTLDFC